MGNIRDFKYKKIKNFFNKNELNILSKYCKNVVRNFLPDLNNLDNQSKAEPGFYSDPLMESMLINKLTLVEKESGLELFPTYSYWRMYTYNADLKVHTDRPACEISVTAHIEGADNQWPIIVEGKEIYTEPGDAVLYLGRELKHERKTFKQDFQSQVFLHYVDKNGSCKDEKFDKRQAIGQKR